MRIWGSPLADPDVLKNRLMTLAALDVILSSDKWLRVHRYEPQWRGGAELGIIDNGAGDDLYIVYAPEGVIIKGFDHLSPMSPHAGEEYGVWPGIYEETPKELLVYLEDNELFEYEDVTFCIWRESGDSQWRTGEVENPERLDDGSGFLLGRLEDTPQQYADWAATYYDEPVQLDAVLQIFSGSAITEELIAALNPKRDAEAALEELDALGIRESRA
ncbi:hypothetical protein [Paenibacillus lutrae]|uniref:Uncharacterized protein n=1 Tax=Paenibacillus lutrae TaxID=2078573 RepID=A0A7X3FKI0_9BACL|nr:hypothetical protein [Paenibacillus lutrae]MVP01287.1 hypothetical protein [Paenibacillus lutrae]